MTTNDQWRQKLTPQQYHVLRERGTETPFSGQYVDLKDDGMYTCAACASTLFVSDTKFDSGCGWPSFYDVVDQGHVKLSDDNSLGMRRVEVTCATCGGHLGHVFEDGPRQTTGLRYCINSAALNFKKKDS